MRFIEEACVGCQICTMVCSLVHTDSTGLASGRIRIRRDYPALATPIFSAVFCQQCREAPCVLACPTGVLKRDGDVVLVDEEACSGCEECVTACPFGAIWPDARTGVVIKCDHCRGDLTCVKYCPHGALTA